MKIAISTDNGHVSSHFGRCQTYTIFEVEDNCIQQKSQVDTPPHQPGFLPKFLHQQGVNCVITGGMGPRAQDLFKNLNIEPIIGVSGPVDQVVQAYLDGSLTTGDSQCTHGSDSHHGCGND